MAGIPDEYGRAKPKTSRAVPIVLALHGKRCKCTGKGVMKAYAREHTTAGTRPRASMTDNIQTFLLGDLSGGVRACVR